ncbi:MAG: dihydropteroate synthase [Niastella sp. SCN 39-18]|nr:dihydropteroate synthase [Sphingobacteriales bacterium]ODT51814.1 MAG: dihydropteroate synthase [Niastella sp. SCN 39-18]OJW10093.1 MAG: dihydropteroate synthase [Sphingobacteriales bacterium 39-19]
MFSINCKGKLLSLQQPTVMGILNITSDSFYKGYLNETEQTIHKKIHQYVMEGAGIIDVGGQSTRPGSARLSAEEEIDRVIPYIRFIATTYPDVFISIDTYSSRVAKEAIQAGAHIVNDISAGLLDAEMIPAIAQLHVPYICMHMQGVPETMQQNPVYTDIMVELTRFFAERVQVCRNAGITDIIIDPGFGFGKTIAHNFSILKNLAAFKILGCPVLIGLSRKSSIYKTLGVSADESLNGTTVLHTIALLQAVQIIRVHDVKEAKEAILLTEVYKKAAL